MVTRGNRRYHDRVAGRYDDIYDRPYWRFYREISWRHLKGYLPTQRPARAADLGCGTGWFGRKLIKSGFDLVFLDPSGAMIEKARQQVDKEGHRGRTHEFIQGEMEDLSGIEDESLAFATGQGDPLSFCKEPKRALQELARVLEPGGTTVLSVDSRMAGVRSLLDAASPDKALELLRTGRTTWLAQRKQEAFPMKMFDPDELRTLLEKTGFELLSTIAKTCLVHRHNEHWLEDSKIRKNLLLAEERVHKLPQYYALAGHLQIAARKHAH